MTTQAGEETRAGSGTALLLRAFWMLLGNAALIALLVSMGVENRALLSVTSLGIWVLSGLIVYARYVDVVHFAGTTSEGDRRATLDDVKSFGKQQFVVAGLAWGLVHAL